MALVLWIIGKFDERKKAVAAQVCVKGGFKVILFLSGVKLTVKGREMSERQSGTLCLQSQRIFWYSSGLHDSTYAYGFCL